MTSALSVTSLQTAGAHWLAHAVHPFGIYQAVLGQVKTDAEPFQPYSYACRRTIRLRPDSDGPPLPHCRNDSRITSAFAARPHRLSQLGQADPPCEAKPTHPCEAKPTHPCQAKPTYPARPSRLTLSCQAEPLGQAD